MLLNEIIRTPANISPSKAQPHIPDNLPPARFVKIGSGVGAQVGESSIYKDKDHQGVVVKVVRIRNLSDPYYRYVRMVEQHQNNPYFPKIYGFNIYHSDPNQAEEFENYYGAGEHYILYVFTEQLYPLHTLGDKKARNFLEQNGLAIEPNWKLKDDYNLRKRFQHADTRKNIRQQTVDPKLRDALRLLEPMFKKFGNDNHVENLMYRRTSKGPQLVFIDPLFPDLGFGEPSVSYEDYFVPTAEMEAWYNH